MLKEILSPIASLKLTLVLLAMAILLVYAGTWAQVDTGIWTVQKIYFHSFYVWINFKTFIPRPPPGQPGIAGGFPFLGGYSIGGLMLINLLSAHAVRFRLTWKRSGVLLIHLGLVLLILGELLTSMLARESQMTIGPGQVCNFSQDTRTGELVVVDPSVSADSDLVVSFPQAQLEQGKTLTHTLVPFEIRIDYYYPNSQLLGPMQPAPPGVREKANAGFVKDQKLAVISKPQVSGTEASVADVASAYVTVSAGGHELGKYLVSYFFDAGQEVQVDGKTYLIALRPLRYYLPHAMSVTLLKFSHDRYLGTDMARNFSSLVRLVDPANNVDRPVLIRMNEPLRYDGQTYYQANFLQDDKTTVLQVVHNPAWTMPYIACVVGALGMLIHFGIMLVTAVSKRSARRANTAAIAQALQASKKKKSGRSIPEPVELPDPIFTRLIPVAAALLAVGIVVTMLVRATTPSVAGDFNYEEFGKLPLNYDGRVLPMDTLARTSLQVILGRQSTAIGSETAKPETWSKIPYTDWISVPATRWLLDTLAGNEAASNYRIFRIDNPELLGLLGLDQDRKPRLFSFNEVMAHKDELFKQADHAGAIADNKRDLLERKVVELYQHVQLCLRLNHIEDLYMLPPSKTGEAWQQLGPYVPTTANPDPTGPPTAQAIVGMVTAFNQKDSAQFNTHLARYQALLSSTLASEVQHADYETFFNRFDPFLLSQILYVLVFVLGCASWLVWAKPFGRAAFAVLIVSVILHTFGLLSRIYISGRPPVTNLYSSAVFIAWAGVVFSIGLESYFRNVISLVGSSAMGFVSLLIAYHLAGEGDTMKQLQAVLDTNGWLATHVVCVTLGYSATFLAGVLAIAYIMLGVFTKFLTAPKPGRLEEDSPAKLLPRMVYAILCFAILFSFVGTVLGGIWADQSWGRFWGWDPKENGAVLIVLWNALTLHARWSGLARRRGVMLLAVFGNVITSWSWFGTNMLGVGLHSYGFMDAALFWLLIFVVSQLLIIAIGNLPLQHWASFSEAEQTDDLPNLQPTAVQ